MTSNRRESGAQVCGNQETNTWRRAEFWAIAGSPGRCFGHQAGQQPRGLRHEVGVPGQHLQGPEQIGLVLLRGHRAGSPL